MVCTARRARCVSTALDEIVLADNYADRWILIRKVSTYSFTLTKSVYSPAPRPCILFSHLTPDSMCIYGKVVRLQKNLVPWGHLP